MTVSKTKAKLVDVARQLFAKMGVENTTMNDIALASKKGRRTLYTYFKSKEDIYLAVVESELDILSDMMKHVVEKDIQPDEKLMEMILHSSGCGKRGCLSEWYSSCQFLSGYLESGESAQTFRCYRDPAFQGGSA
mgnify:CR=1 FL=1